MQERVELIQHVREYGPDGESVGMTRRVKAIIVTDSPLGPSGRNGYDNCGDWIVLRLGNESAEAAREGE